MLSYILSICVIPLINEQLKRDILSMTSVPRDMTVSLKDYLPLKQSSKLEIEIRRVTHEDYEKLIHFVKSEFGERWVESVQSGFNYESRIPIFISQEDGKITGFACFDVVRNKKGLFGPMGTSKRFRTRGVGKVLLHKCLGSMKDLGYEYAIIGQAGPIEFYEKNCGAKLIPLDMISIY